MLRARESYESPWHIVAVLDGGGGVDPWDVGGTAGSPGYARNVLIICIPDESSFRGLMLRTPIYSMYIMRGVPLFISLSSPLSLYTCLFLVRVHSLYTLGNLVFNLTLFASLPTRVWGKNLQINFLWNAWYIKFAGEQLIRPGISCLG